MILFGLALAWALLETSTCIIGPELKGPGRFVIAKDASGKDCLLGKGSSGKVYLGKDLSTGHNAVIKCAFEDAYKSLIVEESVLRHLDHSRIPKVLDSYVDPKTGDGVLVQEYISGKSVNEKIKANEYPSVQAPSQIAQLLSIVHFLHQHGIAHMDIHRGNVMINDKGEVYLIDFGAALNGITGTSGIPGTSRQSYLFADLDSRWRPTKTFGMAVDYYGIATIINNIYLPDQVIRSELKCERRTKNKPGRHIGKDLTPLNPNPKPKSTPKYHAHLLTGMADVDEIIKILTNRNQNARWKDCFESFGRLKTLPFFTNASVDWSQYDWEGKTVGKLNKLSRQFEHEDDPDDDSSDDDKDDSRNTTSNSGIIENIDPLPLSFPEAKVNGGFAPPADTVPESNQKLDHIVIDNTKSILIFAFLMTALTFVVSKRQFY